MKSIPGNVCSTPAVDKRTRGKKEIENKSSEVEVIF